MTFFLKPLQFFAKALTADNSSRQLALGLSLGIVIGLVPKGNLIAVVLMILLCAIRVNLGVGLLAAFAFSWLGMLLDPLTGEIGRWLLTADSLQPMWTRFYNMPLAPWTSFNNTVVLGSFLLGLVLMVPCYFGSRPVFERYVSCWVERLQRYRFIKLVWGLKVAGRLV